VFGLSLGSSDLWMCTRSAELETHLNGRVLGIGQIRVWTSHIDSEYGDLSLSLAMYYLFSGLLSFLELLSFLHSLLLLCIYLIMAYLSIVLT
jgi:hypothetical protein